MNQLSVQDRVQILNALSEGVGINAASRMTGKSKTTILKLLADVGEACALYQDRVMCNLPCEKIECDEIWSFVGRKQKNARTYEDMIAGHGDCYTFTAIDPVTKLMPCWLVGPRTGENTEDFMADLAPRFSKRIQLTEAKRRYSTAPMVSTTKAVICGNPDKKHINTSLVERANSSMRMGMRRFTRLTNAFSKKLQNHMHAVSFYFMVYNFVKIHSSIKTTPATEAGVTDFLWSMEDIVLMADTNS